VGYNSQPSGATVSNEQIFGYSLTGKGTNTGFYGGFSAVYNQANSSSWSTTSDRRIKKNIEDNSVGLDQINQIRVRNFEYRTEDEIDELPTHCRIEKEGVQVGVIAQEIMDILPDVVNQESTGCYRVDPDNLTWYLINAVQELSAKVTALEAQLSGD
jgi:hypothetical protein